MTIVIAVYITLVGLILGSFYNVVALRVPAGESLVRPPSHCTSCGTRLTARDLLPVASYILAGGKCRHCGAKVSPLYMLGEAATGLLFLWIYLQFGLTGQGITGFVLVSLAVIVTVADLKYMLIPNKVLLFFLPLLLVLVLLFPQGPLWSHLLGGAAGGIILLLLALLGGMGMGDMKLFALLGWVVGFPNVILAFMIACALGTIAGVVLMLLGKVKRRQPVPFGPWLAAGSLIAFAYGSQLISGYLALIR
ncbi:MULTISPECIES: A24 family peptidase [unclassified Paenibacillus]|uniref:prepilin peptidase n=1 Tax=unclassified Paenibacillus TaxID=185978 RepID=UPI0024067BBE|nr:MULTISPECIES: A24 family peptidase [unclassified Paenibacillus]MDF9840171.1 leader peptidase (prepilin peptidase)/N-methyltransferase [Paenibacillus sp. PastF-2]MDF9846753.1 leader peptidase (prepilin peptidase)/N-methyltransferase [Paenibacillus sp. PastM-2]MDF9852898.1 leader peptidase (prepilin peptidase)/N-methyltransferase [Paenibacillus sp. PastF-1]MDH6478597.1 leader peptidase (prepilin peptidase)/N-methyltransferase [Paenibacillus sp. PastH-2]MDH6505905.1 leader peptidase (prepilin 